LLSGRDTNKKPFFRHLFDFFDSPKLLTLKLLRFTAMWRKEEGDVTKGRRDKGNGEKMQPVQLRENPV